MVATTVYASIDNADAVYDRLTITCIILNKPYAIKSYLKFKFIELSNWVNTFGIHNYIFNSVYLL